MIWFVALSIVIELARVVSHAKMLHRGDNWLVSGCNFGSCCRCVAWAAVRNHFLLPFAQKVILHVANCIIPRPTVGAIFALHKHTIFLPNVTCGAGRGLVLICSAKMARHIVWVMLKRGIVWSLPKTVLLFGAPSILRFKNGVVSSRAIREIKNERDAVLICFSIPFNTEPSLSIFEFLLGKSP